MSKSGISDDHFQPAVTACCMEASFNRAAAAIAIILPLYLLCSLSVSLWQPQLRLSHASVGFEVNSITLKRK